MDFDRTEMELDYYCRYCCLCVVGGFNFFALLLVFINNSSLDLQISLLVSFSLYLQISYSSIGFAITPVSIYFIYRVSIYFFYMDFTRASNSSPFYFVLYSFLPR